MPTQLVQSNPLTTGMGIPMGGKAQTFPYVGATIAAQTMTLGTLFLTEITLAGGQVVNGAGVLVTTAVTTPTHTWMVIVQAVPSGASAVANVVAVTADQLLTAVALGYYQLNFATPFTVPGDGGPYYLGFASAGTTAGALAGVTTLASTAAFLPAAAATAGTGLTTPPAVGAATAAIAAGTVSFYGVIV